MPFTALSPEGPVSLLGADARTVEALRERNRREACFTARCCGAPLTIRTAPGKAPHFVHQVVPAGCDRGSRETWEHERLKAAIANVVGQVPGWTAEIEATHREPSSRTVAWRADVLASRMRTRVAFEVQLASADYQQLAARQARYRASGVRGLWFVRTRKPLPTDRAVPIFVLDHERGDDRVRLITHADRLFFHPRTPEAESLPLEAFVRAALEGRLRWAPFEQEGEAALQAFVDCTLGDGCPACGRTEARPLAVRVRIAGDDAYPEFQFARLAGLRRPSGWYQPLLEAVWRRAAKPAGLTLRNPDGTCGACAAPLEPESGRYRPEIASIEAALRLGDLPTPRHGSVEQAWLRRWAVLRTTAA